MYRALYDFAAQESGELSIRTGEMLNKVPEEDEMADGWMLVQSLETGGEGYVPTEYVGLSTNGGTDTSVSSSTHHTNTEPDIMSSQMSELDQRSANNNSKNSNDNIYTNTSSMNMNVNETLNDIAASSSVGGMVGGTVGTTTTTGDDRGMELTYSQMTMGTSGSSAITGINTLNATGGKDTVPIKANGFDIAQKIAKLKIAARNTRKERAASKASVINSTSNKGGPRVPSLSAAVEKENLDSLLELLSNYLEKAEVYHTSSMETFMTALDRFNGKMEDCTQGTSELVQKLIEFEDIVDNELQKWKQLSENERSADILLRTKQFSESIQE